MFNEKDTIESREDISRLVDTFYAKIRRDELLGPIFNSHIPNEKWPEHLVKLTNFWETILFGTGNFNGNPSQKHVNVDQNMNHQVEQKHFGVWLQLWFETIDQLFSGEKAEKAKEMARRMAHAQFMNIWHHRSENQSGQSEHL